MLVLQMPLKSMLANATGCHLDHLLTWSHQAGLMCVYGGAACIPASVLDAKPASPAPLQFAAGEMPPRWDPSMVHTLPSPDNSDSSDTHEDALCHEDARASKVPRRELALAA